MPKFYLFILLSVFASPSAFSQIENGKSNWSVLLAPSMDPSKSTLTEIVEIVRGRVHISLITDSTQVIRKVADGDYACESFGWYSAAFQNERGVDEFRPADEFRPHLPQPQKIQARRYRKQNRSLRIGKVTSPVTVAGFGFGDYKLVSDKVGVSPSTCTPTINRTTF